MTLRALDGGAHPSPLDLEEHLFARDGGFDAEGQRKGGGPGLTNGQAEQARIAAHVQGCADCQAVLASLEAQRERWRLDALAELGEALRKEVERRDDAVRDAPTHATRRRLRWLPAPHAPRRRVLWAAALVLAPALWWAAPDPEPPGLRARGEAALATWVEADGRWHPQDRPSAGALVRFEVGLAAPADIVVLGVQDDGVRSLLLPPAAVPAGRALLPGATRLDGYGGGETAELWAREVPWDDDALDALRRGAPPADARRLASAPLRAERSR